MSSFKFVFYLHVLNELFKQANNLSTILQKRELNIMTAFEKANITVCNLMLLKDEYCFNEFIKSSEEICRQNDIDFNLNEFERRTSNHTLIEVIKKEYNLLLDEFISNIKSKFDEKNIKPVIALNEVIIAYKNLDRVKFEDLIIYEKFIDLKELKREAYTFMKYKESVKSVDWSSIEQTIKYFADHELKDFYKQTFITIKLYLTIPITSAEPERQFSALRLLINWLRTTMNCERKSDLTVIKSGLAKGVVIDYDAIINEFESIRSRRMSFH